MQDNDLLRYTYRTYRFSRVGIMYEQMYKEETTTQFLDNLWK